MNNFLKKMLSILAALSLIVVLSDASASGTYSLRDYDQAVRTNDRQQVNVIRSYILGSVETHFLYSKMLKDWTGVNILCMGQSAIQMDDLGAIFELKIRTLRRRYGEDIMDMPVANAVQMIIEEQFKC